MSLLCLDSFLLIILLMPSIAFGGSLLEELEKQGATQLIDLLRKEELMETLGSSTPLTLLAPTNEALDNIPIDVMDELNERPEMLRNFLLSHMLPQRTLYYGDMEMDQTVPSAAPSIAPVRINVYLRSNFYRGYLTVNGKRVSRADITSDVDKSVIHMLTEVMYPLVFSNMTVVDILEGDGRFGTLLSALQVTGLLDTLTEDGPLTIFAPTDEAFEKLDDNAVKELFDGKNRQNLMATLQRHILATKPTMFKRGISWEELETSGGEKIATQVFKNGVIRVASSLDTYATIVDADMIASNGVVHAIDTLI